VRRNTDCPLRALILHEYTTFYSEKFYGDEAAYPDYTFDDYYPVADRIPSLSPEVHVLAVVAESTIDLHFKTMGVNGFLSDWQLSKGIPSSRKNLLVVHSDRHSGAHPLISDHFSVLGTQNLFVDALDWNAYWRPTVAMLNLVFRGADGEYVIGDGASVCSMESWSDGTPVAPLTSYSARHKP
jgi:hypothetical protein